MQIEECADAKEKVVLWTDQRHGDNHEDVASKLS